MAVPKRIHEAQGPEKGKSQLHLSYLPPDQRVSESTSELRVDTDGNGASVVVLPGWEALHGEADAKEVGRYVKASLLRAGTEEGTVLLLPSAIATLGEAAGLVRQGCFEWRATLRDSGAQGEDLWLVGVMGRARALRPEAAELLAEGCALGVAAVVQAAEVAFEGDAHTQDFGGAFTLVPAHYHATLQSLDDTLIRLVTVLDEEAWAAYERLVPQDWMPSASNPDVFAVRGAMPESLVVTLPAFEGEAQVAVVPRVATVPLVDRPRSRCSGWRCATWWPSRGSTTSCEPSRKASPQKNPLCETLPPSRGRQGQDHCRDLPRGTRLKPWRQGYGPPKSYQ